MRPPRIRRQHIRSSLAALTTIGSGSPDNGRIGAIRTIFRNALHKPWPSSMSWETAEELNYNISQADTICRRHGISIRQSA